MSAALGTEESIFHEAAAKQSPEERAAFLDQACAGEAALRDRIEGLLRSDREARSFLARPLDPETTTVPATSSDGPGTVIGSYKLLEPIGEGGMGTVWMAQQTEPVKRLVALKLIKAGMDSKGVIARFEAERQALALMDHPNIAKVFDGGVVGEADRSGSRQTSGAAGTLASSATGRPYFVMELVKGQPITRYCDEHHLTPRQRLELFIPVCHAIQHAHQKGIIHRDLKPSNVLVALYDGRPVPKVIDFGVAKAAGQPLTEHTLVTGFGTIVGTLEYMSPEQAETNQLDVDTRSDIYSLGVLLYELLAGTTPLERERVNKSGILEALRIIREEEIPTLSNRLSTTAELPAIAANRGLEPAKLTKLVRGELDWIVMKALEKDRNRRYESASGLAADVQRYLRDEPAQACPPSVRYRLRKFVRRNKTAVATASVVCLAVFLAVGGLAVSYSRVRQVLEREQQALYFQRVKTAAREQVAGNWGRAEQSLDDCPSARRRWEWHYLKRRRFEDPRVLPVRDAVLIAAYSPDGRCLASGCVDGSIAVWDTWNWSPVRTLHQGMKHVYSLAFSRDGRYLASGGGDPDVLVWDVSNDKPVHTLRHAGTVRQVAFSPDDNQLATAGEDGFVRLWSLGSGQPVREFDQHREPVRGVAFTAEGRVISAGVSGVVKVWDPATGDVTASHRGQLRSVSVMAFHAPSGRLALGDWDGSVEVWDSLAGGEPRALDGHTKDVTGLAFNSDGTRLVSAADDRALRLWDIVSGQEALTIEVGDITPISVAFGSDGRQLAVGCGQHLVKVCDGTPLSGNEKKDELRSFIGHTDLVLRVAFDRDSRKLVSTSRDGTAKVWDVEMGRLLLDFRKHTRTVSSAVFSPGGKLVASAGWDGKVLVWHAETGEVTLALEHDAGFVHDVAFSPNGLMLASAHADGTVILWDTQTGEKQVIKNAHGYEAVSVSFDCEGKRLTTAGGRDHSAYVWDVQTGRKSVSLDFAGNERAVGRVRRATFSPNGRSVATVGHGNMVRSCMMVWDAATGERRQTIEGPGTRLYYLAFSPDGSRIAAGGQDDAVRIWDWDETNGKESQVLRGHAGEIHGLAFSPNSQFLASCGGYKGRGEIKLWDATRRKQD